MQMQVSSSPASGIIVICGWMVIYDIMLQEFTAFLTLNDQKMYTMQTIYMIKLFTNTYVVS